MKAIAMAIFACGLAACMADEPVPADNTDPVTDPDALIDVQSDDAARPAQTSTTADDLGGEPNAPDVAAAQNCVFIEWCDQPGGNGTVCIVRNTAACQAQCGPGLTSEIINECNADARAVCGRVASPARIFCSLNHP